MTKFIAAIFSLALLAAAVPAQACPFSDQESAKSTPVVTSDANGTAPMTPVPPTTTTAPKTGG